MAPPTHAHEAPLPMLGVEVDGEGEGTFEITADLNTAGHRRGPDDRTIVLPMSMVREGGAAGTLLQRAQSAHGERTSLDPFEVSVAAWRLAAERARKAPPAAPVAWGAAVAALIVLALAIAVADADAIVHGRERPSEARRKELGIVIGAPKPAASTLLRPAPPSPAP